MTEADEVEHGSNTLAAQLSRGRVARGQITCPYHGWTYDAAGRVVRVPSEGPTGRRDGRCTRAFAVREEQGYVYVRLAQRDLGMAPFAIPRYGERGWKHYFHSQEELVEYLRTKRPRGYERYMKKRRELLRKRRGSGGRGSGAGAGAAPLR